MSNENKIVEEKQSCLCQSKGFRKFLVTTAGTFVGAFCAISLFAALHRPPMPPMMPAMPPAGCVCPCHFGYHGHHHFKHHAKTEFDKPIRNNDMKPFVSDRVN